MSRSIMREMEEGGMSKRETLSDFLHECKLWWRTNCMSLMAHMDGTQCEEVHLLYIDRMGSFVIRALDNII